MLRTSKHSIKDLNLSKEKELSLLISNYRSLTQKMIDFIWSNGYQDFNVTKNKLELSTFIDSTFLKNFSWDYTERLKQAAGKQALMLISSSTEKRRKQLWQLKELQKQGKNTKYLQRAISIHHLKKPNAANINPELDSRFVDFNFTNNDKFLGFVKISSFKKGSEIKIPITKSKVYDKWNNLGKLKNCIRLSNNNINLIFEIEDVPKKEEGIVVGCDQGILDVVTLSDNQKIPKYQDKYTFSDVLQRLARREKGSKGFKRASEFRKNIINWSINQLNFDNIKEVRVEKLFQLGKGVKRSRFLAHWAYTLTNDKVARLSEEKGFLLTEMPNEFRSQRCYGCAWVCKANRKGKTFCCKKCGNANDADLNAASNLLLDLYEIPKWVRLKKINRKGFYWKADGLYTESYESIVHNTEEE